MAAPGFCGVPCCFTISLPSQRKSLHLCSKIFFRTLLKAWFEAASDSWKGLRKELRTSPLTMWTFLGIASFIYVYKKCGDLMTYANKEVLLSVLVFFSLGLLLSYRYRFRGSKQQQQQQQQQRKSHLGVFSDLLSALPLVGFFWAKPTAGSQQAERPKSRKVGSIQT